MTWTAPNGTLASMGMHNTNTSSLTTHAVGNLIVLITTNHDQSGTGAQFVNGVSSSRVTWTQITSTVALSNPNPTPATWCANIWQGVVNSVGSDTVTVSWAFADDSAACNHSGYEYNSSIGSWHLDTWTTINAASGTSTWSALTPAASGELYQGFAWNSGASVAGSTSGYVYDPNADGHDGSGNGGAYRLSCPAGTPTAPTWGDSTQDYGLVVLMAEGAGTPATLPQMQEQVPVYYQQRVR